jgi:Outer membrane protein beta-barrel domain
MRSRLATGLLAIAATPALADGFYVGAEVGVAATDDIVSADPEVLTCAPVCNLDAASLDGIRLDTRESAWSAFAGWTFREWLSLELAYADLGEAKETLQLGAPPLYTPQPGIVISIDPDVYFADVPPAGGFLTTAAIDLGWVALGMKEMSVNAVFRHGLTERFSAWWLLGVSHATFDARGYYEVNEIVSFQPLVVELRQIPFVTPDDETGYRWGFGAEYALNERFSLQLGYRRHELQVIDTETLSVRFLARL